MAQGGCYSFTAVAVYSITFLCQLVAGDIYDVFEEQLYCVDHRAIYLSCPQETAIVIQSANIYRSSLPVDQGVCPRRHPASGAQYCSVEDVSKEVIMACASKKFEKNQWVSHCTYDPITAKMNEQQCGPTFRSRPYVVVKYLCEAKFQIPTMNTAALAMEIRTPQSFQGSKVHIDSEDIWLSLINGSTHLDYIYSESKVCCIHVPPYTEMLVYPYIFVKEPAQTGRDVCNQRLEILEGGVGGGYYPFCTQTTVPKIYPKLSHYQVYGVSYKTVDDTVGVVFVLNVQVSHKTAFRVECGITMSACKVPPTPPTPPTNTRSSQPTTYPAVITVEPSPPTQQPEKLTSSDTQLLPIIIGCILAAVFILIIIVIIALTRYRGKEETTIVESESDPGSVAYITGMYLEGDQMSQLTLVRKQDPANIMYASNTYNYIPAVTNFPAITTTSQL